MPNGARHWCFTLNNYVDEDVTRIRELGGSNAAEFVVFGREVGESGTPHLQGYICFSRRTSLRCAREAVGTRAHLEIMRGTPSQAAAYCEKGGEAETYGELPGGRGHRSDIQSAYAAVKAGTTKRELLELFTVAYARAPRMLSEALLLHAPCRKWKTVVKVYYGETGTGKTRKAYEEAEAPYVHPGGVWFDGYDGEQDVIFDDFGGSEFKLTYLLKLLDRYPMRVPVKGGFVQWVPRNIWITSNYPVNEWYPHAKDEHKKALRRRIETVMRFRRMSSVMAVDDSEVEYVFPGV